MQTPSSARQIVINLHSLKTQHENIKASISAAGRAGVDSVLDSLRIYIDPIATYYALLSASTVHRSGDLYAVPDEAAAWVLNGARRQIRPEHRRHVLRALMGTNGYLTNSARELRSLWDVRIAVASVDRSRRVSGTGADEGARFRERTAIRAASIDRLRDAVARVQKWTRRLKRELREFVPAQTLGVDHDIPLSRLSEATTDGLVPFRLAQAGMVDRDGQRVRKLYHRRYAIKHCSPRAD